MDRTGVAVQLGGQGKPCPASRLEVGDLLLGQGLDRPGLQASIGRLGQGGCRESHTGDRDKSRELHAKLIACRRRRFTSGPGNPGTFLAQDPAPTHNGAMEPATGEPAANATSRTSLHLRIDFTGECSIGLAKTH
jgi:hypothetical protein